MVMLIFPLLVFSVFIGLSEAAYRNPLSPLIPCENLPLEFIECDQPYDLNTDITNETRFGCTKFGGNRYEDVQRTKVRCFTLLDIDCAGNRSFISRHTVPCIRYSGHYFCTIFIYSILTGYLGVDRFFLGHTGTAVGKLLTLGGFGIWWVVDIILLIIGELNPADGSNWQPFY